MARLAKDPVCGAEIDPERIHAAHRGLEYGFCSPQCRERFLAKPELYVGWPGHKAPKQEGLEILKKRRLRLAEPLSPAAAAILGNELLRSVGIRDVRVRGDTVDIAYDLLETTAETIAEEIAAIGLKFAQGWSERLRLAFVEYEEECELDNLAADDRPCCEVKKR